MFSTFFNDFLCIFCYFLIKFICFSFYILYILHILFHSKQSGWLNHYLNPFYIPLCLQEGRYILLKASGFSELAAMPVLGRQPSLFRISVAIATQGSLSADHIFCEEYCLRTEILQVTATVFRYFYAVTLCNPFEILIFVHKNSRHKNT